MSSNIESPASNQKMSVLDGVSFFCKSKLVHIKEFTGDVVGNNLEATLTDSGRVRFVSAGHNVLAVSMISNFVSQRFLLKFNENKWVIESEEAA